MRGPPRGRSCLVISATTWSRVSRLLLKAVEDALEPAVVPVVIAFIECAVSGCPAKFGREEGTPGRVCWTTLTHHLLMDLRPMIDARHQAWIENYIDLAGADFLKVVRRHRKAAAA